MERGTIRAILLAALALAVPLAGCLGGQGPATDEGGPPATPSNTTPEEPGSGEGASGASSTDASGPIESPAWEIGDWWRYRVEHTLGPTTNVTLVVADASPDTYRLGWTETTPGLPSLLYHMPPAGELSRPNLGWWWHDETVHIAEFPLEDGKTWTAALSDADVTYTAQRATNASTVAIEGVNATGARVIEAVYDADVGFFTRMARYFDADGDASPSVTLAEHGTLDGLPGNGTVQVPTMTDLLDHGIVGPDPAAGRPLAGDPAGTFQVGEETSRLALGAFLGGAEGVYEAAWQPPDAGPDVMVETNGPGDAAMNLFTAFPTEPAGTWGYEATPGGPGVIFLEAVSVSLDPVEVSPASN